MSLHALIITAIFLILQVCMIVADYQPTNRVLFIYLGVAMITILTEINLKKK